MRIRIELGKEDIKGGTNKKAKDLTLSDFSIPMEIAMRAEFIVFKGPDGKKREMKTRGKAWNMDVIW